MASGREIPTVPMYEVRKQEYINELLPYLDHDIKKSLSVEEQRLSCESELIIGHELLSNRYILAEYKTRKNPGGPDFLLDHDGRNVWIEVVAPREGQYSMYKHEESMPLEEGQLAANIREVDNNNCILKIASAIRDKTIKYNDYVDKNILAKDDMKIICVNVRTFGSGGTSCPYVANVLYGIAENWWVDTKTYESGVSFGQQKPVIKKTGKEIDMGLFVQDGYKDIDGVLWFDYSLGQLVPDECRVYFYANNNKKERIDSLFDCWDRVFYENGVLQGESGCQKR